MKWLQTDYFSDFHCKCGDCRSSCCDIWNISITRDEYVRLSEANCSDDLFRRIKCSLRIPEDHTPERYCLITRNFMGKCPMHDPDGLCAVQKELGEGAISEICRVFPRSMHRKGSINRAVCSAGCEAVIEILDRPEKLQIIEVENDLPVNLVNDSSPSLYENLFHYIAILQDSSISLRDRIMKVCRQVKPDFPDCDPSPAFPDELMPAIEKLQPYSPILQDLYESIVPVADWEHYIKEATAFEERFPNHDRLFENLIVNHLIYEDFPETDPRMVSPDSVYGLCFVYALMRFISITSNPQTMNDLADVLTSVFRYIEHTSFYYNGRTVLRHPERLLVL